ncbi:GyrI-like domain-containing protein [Neolewinella litorea]|uniref:AraC family transcriptional regulator n=1 Tax=Neolewinella litorea TaxID=2562452 RepID=A0A4V3XL48_9BACT|nr:GyrI-like domain-containing protein [Neolewinella litorea]THH39473.1 AraC family transcriptional regulator [Neolewinella litorea]
MTEVTLQDLAPIHLVGLSQLTTLAALDTPTLWRAFAPRIGEVNARADAYRYAVREYPTAGQPLRLEPDTEYREWAAVALTNADDSLPEGLQLLKIPGGIYAHCIHRGLASEFGRTLDYLFRTWLPASGYSVDNSRPHFERMGPNYRLDDPEATEEVFVPVVPADSPLHTEITVPPQP